MQKIKNKNTKTKLKINDGILQELSHNKNSKLKMSKMPSDKRETHQVGCNITICKLKDM